MSLSDFESVRQEKGVPKKERLTLRLGMHKHIRCCARRKLHMRLRTSFMPSHHLHRDSFPQSTHCTTFQEQYLSCLLRGPTGASNLSISCQLCMKEFSPLKSNSDSCRQKLQANSLVISPLMVNFSQAETFFKEYINALLQLYLR